MSSSSSAVAPRLTREGIEAAVKYAIDALRAERVISAAHSCRGSLGRMKGMNAGHWQGYMGHR